MFEQAKPEQYVCGGTYFRGAFVPLLQTAFHNTENLRVISRTKNKIQLQETHAAFGSTKKQACICQESELSEQIQACFAHRFAM